MSTSIIAQLNDAFRRTGMDGHMVMTRGISSLPKDVQCMVFYRVRTFDAFTSANDPYGEHDFGAFDHPGVGKVFWKIDYYDPTMQYGSEDPANPSKTRRVLTIMLAEEY